MSDTLTEAILAAGRELGEYHTWCFDDDGSIEPNTEQPFFQVMYKHLRPLCMPGGFITSEIAAAKAKLAALEKLQLEDKQ